MREAQASSRVFMLSKQRRSLNCYTMAQRGLWKFGGAIHRSVDAKLDAMAAQEHGPLVAAEPSPKRPRLLDVRNLVLNSCLRFTHMFWWPLTGNKLALQPKPKNTK